MKTDHVLIRRHSAFDTMRQPLFDYSPTSGTVEPATDTQAEPDGWLIDFEKVVSGAKRVIFFRRDGKRFVALDDAIFVVGESLASMTHRRGLFFSALTVVDERGGEHTPVHVKRAASRLPSSRR